jgi:neurofibromin 1
MQSLHLLTRRPIFKEKRIEWQNYTLFLVSYCGGNFMDRSLYVKTPLVFGTLASWFASEDLPERFKTQTDYDALMREYIASLIDLLVHENMTVRETAKEALGPESQLQLFSMIVLQLDRFVQWNMLPPYVNFLASQCSHETS